MRSSRVSQDTARLFDQAAAATVSATPRRTTRSLSRFAYAPVSGNARATAAPPDIEDAISPPPAAKRRRKLSSESPAKPIKQELLLDDTSPIRAPPTKKTKQPRKPARKTVDPDTGATTVAPPSNWEEVYGLVRVMRAPGGPAHGAAVDTMGCERLADRTSSEKDQRFHTLIALMLSSQTKDTVNAVVMRRLQTELAACRPGAPPGLNLDNVLAVDPDTLNQMIWAVGFHNNKTKYIKKAAEILRDEWDGDIPDTIEGLTALPGVGPKMGYLCLSAAWGRTEGIGVDVHVHRITNLWGWHATKTPEETRLALQAWLPRDRWREINGLLVGLGQAVCLPVGRRCGSCDVGLEGLCRAADRKKVALGRAERETARLQEEDRKALEDAQNVKKEEEP
ncbi:DNA glycosylase [Cordyceps fumosorosea ARSEF 2679]|uniref:Endonuclease III homolog n=1 Tax=Cordyceps fumosorosea (strain ARSEF 2679) TaxID=1081104 RepID=A0A162I6D5_CORFA|nr:DNA glycosylase [Cordyceps fumosorosea ARSEF 2679]OAA52895.1 DNA glycosylase [Cordyceps fumosorosea ARSEF 2679]